MIFHCIVFLTNCITAAFFRCHIVGQFNRGLYEVIVASDEKFLDEMHEELADSKAGKTKKLDKDKERSKRDKDKESGVARGIDFQVTNHANIILYFRCIIGKPKQMIM